MTQPNPTAPPIPGLITPDGMTPPTYSTPANGNSISGATPPAAAQAPAVPPPAAPPADGGEQVVTIPAPGTPNPAAAAAAPKPAETAPTPVVPDGYPADTPLDQMTPEQREAYWRAHARRWENLAKQRQDYDNLKAAADELARLKEATATDHEKAIAAARSAGYAEAAAKAAVVLVDAHVRANLNARLTPDRVDALAGHLDHKHFLSADGMTVDAEKVTAFVNAVAPLTAQPVNAVTVQPGQQPPTNGVAPAPWQYAPPQATATAPPAPLQPGTGLPRALPDLGQGSTTPAKPTGLAAGAEMARQMFGDRQQRP